jgi:CHAT domain-containing protein/Tfp pilus assembly protein PilF
MRRVICLSVACLALAGALRAQSSTGTAPGAASVQSKSAIIEPDKSIEKALAGGQRDVFEIQVNAGQFLHAIVEQLGIDVGLTLRGPDGKTIASMDSPNGTVGLEQISTIAESSGIYVLEIACDDKSSPAARYRVLINPLRTPTDADRARISAERVFNEATLLSAQGNRESLLSAIQKYETSLPLWRTAGDAYEEALCLYNLSLMLDGLGDRARAISYMYQALSPAKASGDGNLEVMVVSGAGMSSLVQGKTQEALEYFQEELSLAKTFSLHVWEAGATNNIGQAYSKLGEKQKAIEYLTQALKLHQQVGSLDGQSAALDNIGLIYDDLGDRTQALEYLNKALAIDQETHDRASEATALNNLGLVNNHLGEKGKALEYYSKALAIYQTTGNQSEMATTLNNIGKVYDDLGEKQKALDDYSRSFEINRKLGNRFAQSISLNNIGGAYQDLGQKQKALDTYIEALQLEREVGNMFGQSVTLDNIAQVYSSLGKYQEALDYYNQALSVCRKMGSRSREATSLNNIGTTYEAMGDLKTASDNYFQSLGYYRTVTDPMGQGNVLANLMRNSRKRGNAGLAIFFGKQSINAFQQIRGNIKGLDQEAQQSFLKSKEQNYRELAALLVSQGRLPEAQQVLDFLKLEEYSEFTQRRGDSSSDAKPVALTPAEEKTNKEYELIAADITAISSEWTQLRAKSPRSSDEEKRFNELSEQVKTANQRWQSYLTALYDTFGKGDQANARVGSIKDDTSNLQSNLGLGTAGVYTLVLDEKCELIVITQATQVEREVLISKIALRSKVNDLVLALQQQHSGQEIKAKARDLYNILIAPIEKDLEGTHAKTLVWSLDDVLRYVPLAALYDGTHYLVERYRNIVVTTMSVGNLKDKPQVSSWRGAAMGVSKDYDGLGQLKAVPGELSSVIHSAKIAGSHGPIPGTILLDDSFTEKSMETALEEHPPLVHIASHYVFQLADDKSYLLLGGKETGGQGFHLTLADLRDDKRIDFDGIELLTLSGCQTAVGSKDSDGREIDGLGITAQRKGAKAVMATLWPVDDASVGTLMATFYKVWINTPGMAKAEALQKAQVALLHGVDSHYSNPYYWAPFILIGNWK